MGKTENILNLYSQLHANGKKTKAVVAIADACGISPSSVKSNWLLYKSFPERHQDTIVSILQKMVKNQNQEINAIEVK